MRNNRRASLTTCLGSIVTLQTASAFASPEGAAMADAILLIVAIAFIALIALMVAGGIIGGFRSKQKGESILKGGAYGVLKGVVAFLILCVTSTIALTVLNILWVAYSFFYVYVLAK